MQRFAELLESLVFQPARNGKLRLIETYLRETPDPDRGYGLAALTDSLVFNHAKPALIRGLVEERVDPARLAGCLEPVPMDLRHRDGDQDREDQHRPDQPGKRGSGHEAGAFY